MNKPYIYGMTKRIKRLNRDLRIARSIAETLGLKVFYFNMKIPLTDLDVVGLDYNYDVVVGEVKTRLHEDNYIHAIRQLDFRRHIANRVYLAVPERDVYFALAVIPQEYGIIGIAGRQAYIVKKSKLFNPMYKGLFDTLL